MAAFNDSAALAATTNTTLRTITAGKAASFSVTLCNRTASAVTVRLAHAAATSTPTTAEWILYDYSLAANAMVQLTGLVAMAGKLVVAYASAASVAATVYGFEE